MGRVKLQIKKIENTTNRQVTYSKRRNGLIKKAYELSVLCEVDVALILFSPSGRLTTFAGNNKSIEDIISRYLNLPEQEKGRVQSQETKSLQRALGKMKCESSNRTYQVAASPMSNADSQLQEIKQLLAKSKSRMEEMEQRLRIYEYDPSDVTTLSEAQYRERMLEYNLNLRALMEEEKFNQAPDMQAPSEVNLGSETTMNTNDFVAANADAIPIMNHWLPADKDPHSQIFNFLGSNGFLPMRDETGSVNHHHHHHQPMENMVAPALPLLHVPNVPLVDHHVTSTDKTENDKIGAPRAAEFYQQLIDVNVSTWAQYLAPPGASVEFQSTYPRDRALLEAFISQLTTPPLTDQDQI